MKLHHRLVISPTVTALAAGTIKDSATIKELGQPILDKTAMYANILAGRCSAIKRAVISKRGK